MLRKPRLRVTYVTLGIYFVMTYLADIFSFGNIVMAASLGLMLVTTVMKDSLRVKKGWPVFICWLFLFSLYCVLSRLWAEQPSLCRNKTNAMIYLCCFMSVIYYCTRERMEIDALLCTIMYASYIVLIYIFLYYGYSRLITVIRNSSRAGEVINSNSMGMCAGYALLINLHYILYEKKLHPRDLLMLVGILMLVASGSRKAFLIVIGGAFALFVLKNISRNFINTCLKVLFTVLILALLLYLVMQLPFMSSIRDRFADMFTALAGGGTRKSTDGWLRVQYVQLGWDLFKKNAVLGIGLGNANIYTMQLYGRNHYLHNNFVELLATLGGVGFLLYYGMYAYMLGIFWRCRRFRDRLYDICLVLMVVRIVMDYGVVSFYNKEAYVFLLVFWYEAVRLKRMRKQSLAVQPLPAGQTAEAVRT